ncbi:hypothetical protein JXB28_03365 [Candidatus Woesearchaeota archaeon]|nr:hypothetical protein [Candidatus Woesearchaeota archaeon]
MARANMMLEEICKKIQKARLKKAYVNYYNLADSLSCGEQLGHYISNSLYQARENLVKQHEKMKELDPECPDLKFPLANYHQN